MDAEIESVEYYTGSKPDEPEYVVQLSAITSANKPPCYWAQWVGDHYVYYFSGFDLLDLNSARHERIAQHRIRRTYQHHQPEFSQWRVINSGFVLECDGGPDDGIVNQTVANQTLKFSQYFNKEKAGKLQ